MKDPLYFKNAPVVVVMGVCGCGKSTIAKALSTRLDLPYLEGDDFHPPENVEKMSNSISLTDDDRWPWLDSLGTTFKNYCNDEDSNNESKSGVVASCSALKRSYRERLSDSSELPILFVLLDGSRETLLSRMQGREDHYMPTSLLDSQLEILEKPTDKEVSLTVSIEKSIDNIVDEILNKVKDLS